jgi:hypothetical protein
VLPLRFGAALSGEDAVAGGLLEAHYDQFADALDDLDGRAQYVVKGRYVQDAIMEEVLAENTQAARLAESVRGKDAHATRTPGSISARSSTRRSRPSANGIRVQAQDSQARNGPELGAVPYVLGCSCVP